MIQDRSTTKKVIVPGRQARSAIHNAVNLHNAGYRPALVGGGWRHTEREASTVAQFAAAAAMRGFEIYFDGPERNGMYLREAQS